MKCRKITTILLSVLLSNGSGFAQNNRGSLTPFSLITEDQYLFRDNQLVMFEWQACNDAEGRDVSYSFLVARDPFFKNVIHRVDNLSDTMIRYSNIYPVIPIDILEPLVPYFWTVIARNDGGDSCGADTLSFRVVRERNKDLPVPVQDLGARGPTLVLEQKLLLNLNTLNRGFGNPPEYDPKIFRNAAEIEYFLRMIFWGKWGLEHVFSASSRIGAGYVFRPMLRLFSKTYLMGQGAVKIQDYDIQSPKYHITSALGIQSDWNLSRDWGCQMTVLWYPYDGYIYQKRFEQSADIHSNGAEFTFLLRWKLLLAGYGYHWIDPESFANLDFHRLYLGLSF